MTNHSRKDSKQGSVLAFSEINSSVEVQASQWLARLDGETPSLETRQEFKAWINADPAHRKAFEVYIEFWDEMNILDRLNIHFKGGPSLGVKFASEELYLVRLIEQVETFDDAIRVTEEIMKHWNESDEPEPEMMEVPGIGNGSNDGDDEDPSSEEDD